MEPTVIAGVADLRISGAIDFAWAQRLRDHAAALAARDDVRVVRLAAEGRLFCPGGDLAWMAAQEDPGAAVGLLADTLHEGLLTLLGLEAPVVARVHGAAAGAGMSLVLAADVAICARSAAFTVAYSGVGLSPDGGMSWLLPRAVGAARAREIMLSNRKVTAEEAAAIGMVARVVDDEALDAEVDALVARLAAGPTPTYGAMKRLLDAGATAPLAQQLDAEAATIARLAGGPTGREGIAAFLAKRAPDFQPR